MIDVQSLAKSFTSGRGRKQQKVAAVEEVSFIALDGRITALLGPNGAGKTTTLRILSTLMTADRGRATVGGIDVAADPAGARAAMGMLSDSRGLYTRLTARENVAYYAALRGVPQQEFERRLADLAQLLDMEVLLDRPTAGFSTGERLKVALARALIHDPQHLVLDEPTNGLDVMSTRALRRLLLALRERGKCIVFSTHIMQEVDAICDEIVIVSHGRSIAHGTAESLRAQTGCATLEDAFVSLAFAPAPAPARAN
jgi:sodium transport system ATP-binding protein